LLLAERLSSENSRHTVIGSGERNKTGARVAHRIELNGEVI
jgi:hypothetical protein